MLMQMFYQEQNVPLIFIVGTLDTMLETLFNYTFVVIVKT